MASTVAFGVMTSEEPTISGQAEGTDDLADAAEAIGGAHAGGAQAGRPDLGQIGADNREAAVVEEVADDDEQPEQGYAAEEGIMQVAGRGDGDGAAEARQHAGVAAANGVGQPGEGDAAGDAGELDPQEQIGGVGGGDAELQHEQGGGPEANAIGRGLRADAGHEGDSEAFGIEQQVAPGSGVLFRGVNLAAPVRTV